MFSRNAVLPVVLTLAAGLSPAFAQGAATPSPEQAQAIVEGLLQSQLGPNTDLQVTYGGVPASLPLTLGDPLKVLLSVRTRYAGGALVNHRVLATSALPPDQARAELDRRLGADGWKPQNTSNPPLGFITPQQPIFSNYYREGNTNFGLYVNVVGRDDGSSRLELNVNPISAQQLAALKKQAWTGPKSSLPLLNGLPGAKIAQVASATSPNGALSTVRVQSDRSANEVLAFYSAQLRAAGWRARADTVDGPLRAITYTLRDLNGREALGTLGIRPWEKEGGGYVLTVSVQGFKP